MADPGFPVGGPGPRRRGCGLPRQLCFENFVCQNERIGTLRGARARARPPRSANAIFITVKHWKAGKVMKELSLDGVYTI